MSDENENSISLLKPNWNLIDEISIPLLEQGIGSFDILQQTLPSIVLTRFEKIDKEWTEARMIKMYRIAQLQIQYILQSQQTLVKELEQEREKVTKVNKINQAFRKSVMQSQRSSRELFKCDECSKIFLHSTFLADHIQRKHRSSSVLTNHEPETPKLFATSAPNNSWK
uniref:C2H2-type domain-containing protein n=1 Tax=Panagrolaimus sp. ES5 TaxID=591445 RepID=A0AC34G7Z0_9BILA